MNHLRKGGYGGWRSHFTVEMSELFDDVYVNMLYFRGLLLYTVDVIFHYYWCTRKPRLLPSYSTIALALHNTIILIITHISSLNQSTQVRAQDGGDGS